MCLNGSPYHLRICLWICCILCIGKTAYGQNQQNIWYFGNNAGLDFNGASVVALTNGTTGSIYEIEGTAGICDSIGIMLFYSNGEKVWNKNNQVMPNGTGILSNASSTQSSLIIPLPGSQHLFYLFTVDDFFRDHLKSGFRYSVIDMCLENGLGDVLVDQKNISVLDTVAEKLTAVRHQNGVDYWIIVHKFFSDGFYAYLFSSSGLSSTPVISNIGSVHDCNSPGCSSQPFNNRISSAIGQMKASPDGSRLALVTNNNYDMFRELFDFDKSTGQVSNFIDLDSGIINGSGSNYGVSFSPDNSKLYTTQISNNRISQHDLSAGGGDPDSIRNSEYLVANYDANSIHGIQLGPDGKIYVSHGSNTFLGIINNPNTKGSGCNYVTNGISLNGKSCSYGMPNMVDAFDYSNTIIELPTVDLGSDTSFCTINSFVLKDTNRYESYLWSTNATDSFIMVNSVGEYWLEVTNYIGCKKRDTIAIFDATPSIHLGNDTILCGSSSFILKENNHYANYLWNTSSTDSFISITTSGTYWLEAYNQPTCKASDTIMVSFATAPSVVLGNDTSICDGQSIILTSTVSNATHLLWNTADTTTTLSIDSTGIYWLEASNASCKVRDTINIIIGNGALIDLGNDTTLCEDATLILDATSPGATYKWQDGSTSALHTANSSGQYKVTVTRQGCSSSDSIMVYHEIKPVLDIGPDTSYCFDQPVTLDASPSGAYTYLWQDGSSSPFYIATSSGLYWVEIKKIACQLRDTVLLSQKSIPFVDLGLDKKICKEDSVILDAGSNTTIAYVWNTSSVNQQIKATAPGIYSVIVTNTEGCLATDSIVLDTFLSPPVNLGPDTFICEGSSIILNQNSPFTFYLWQDGSTKPTFEARTDGIYYIQVTNQNFCKSSDTVIITVKAKPVINIASVLKLCEPDTFITPKQQFNTYLWQDGTTLSSLHITNYGTYSVTVTDSNTCSNTAIVEVVNNCPATLFVPNVFTPNGDDNNDVFYPVTVNVKSITWQVYNRWGEQVFETNEFKKGWDGTFANQKVQADVYAYIITYVDMSNETHVEKGNVTLLR